MDCQLQKNETTAWKERVGRTYAKDDVEQLLADPAEEDVGHHAHFDPLVQVEEVVDLPHTDLVALVGVGREGVVTAQL
jgi:hypothetical protein